MSRRFKISGSAFYVDVMSDSQEVTGSCLYCTVHFPDNESTHFIVDCGLFQESEYNDLNNELLFDPSKVDFALITHNHIDHIGRLPFLVKNGFNSPIYTTVDTCTLLPLALNDTSSILRGRAKKTKNPPLYTDTDVSKTINLVNGIPYGAEISMSKNIKCTFFPNGHLFGAALILVQIEYYGFDPINILFMGDYNNKNMFFDVPPLPDWVLNLPLTIVCESTYGYMDSSEIFPCFVNNILTFFENNPNGTLILPVFSLGRSQEMLKTLKILQDEKRLPDVPIYLDGKLTLRYTKLIINNHLVSVPVEKNDILPYNLQNVCKDSRLPLLTDKYGKIIVSSSGMGSYGPVQCYIQHYLKRQDALIHFTGYCAENTLGRRLYDAKENDFVNFAGLLIQKKAAVKFTNEFSAHAKSDELIEFLQQFKQLTLVCITHGQTQVKENFSKKVSQEVETENVGILSRDYFFRIKPKGDITTLPTHFI